MTMLDKFTSMQSYLAICKSTKDPFKRVWNLWKAKHRKFEILRELNSKTEFNTPAKNIKYFKNPFDVEDLYLCITILQNCNVDKNDLDISLMRTEYSSSIEIKKYGVKLYEYRKDNVMYITTTQRDKNGKNTIRTHSCSKLLDIRYANLMIDIMKLGLESYFRSVLDG